MQVLFKEDIRNIETGASALGFSTYNMMTNAGVAAAEVICEKFNVAGKQVLLLAGNGNNGGDGFITAKKLYDEGANVSVLLTAGLPKSENAKLAVAKLSEYPIRVYNYTDADTLSLIKNADIIIDAMFGIGFHGEVQKAECDIIKLANSADAKRVALDIPSGCVCDTGEVGNICFNADITITFIAVKPCHILYPASDYCGKLIKVGIGIPASKMPQIDSHLNIITNDILNKLPKLRKNEHKGTRGTVLNISGSYGMAGAAILSSLAAYKSGAGKVKTVLPKSIYPIAAAALLEAVYIVSDDVGISGIIDEVSRADSVLIGCGCGISEHFTEILKAVVENARCPVVIDADGINALKENINILTKSSADIIITPHPAEMARLLGTTTKEIVKNRIKAAKLLAQKMGITVVLKGANTLVALKSGEMYVCMCGNPGMATAGSGDVLSGIIAALCAGGTDAETSAVCGVQLHAMSGDAAAQKLSMHSLCAKDIVDNIHIPFLKIEELD